MEASRTGRKFTSAARLNLSGSSGFVKRPADERPVSKYAVAEMILHPFVVVDRVDIAFSEVRRDGHRGEIIRVVLLQPADGAEDHRACGASKQESMFAHSTACTDGVGLLDEDEFVNKGLVELRRRDGRA